MGESEQRPCIVGIEFQHRFVFGNGFGEMPLSAQYLALSEVSARIAGRRGQGLPDKPFGPFKIGRARLRQPVEYTAGERIG